MASKNSILHILFLPILVSLFFFLTEPRIDLHYPAAFNFGDSNSDTGNLVAGTVAELDPPYGHTFFHQPSGRFCDGRLVIDFLMEAMDLPFLNPYLEAIGAPSFQKGCNYAAAGSTIVPNSGSVSPFSFGVQVSQFLRFKSRVLDFLAQGKKLNKYLPQEKYFRQGLYMFDIGQNDLAIAFRNQSEDQVIASIPSILLEFKTGIEKLYAEGARRFWIHNTGPLGCLPQSIALFGNDPSRLDEHGCVSTHNGAAKYFNLQLHALCTQLQHQYSDASVIYIDIFSIKLELISNYSKYGFVQPIMACCGYGGPPLNFDNIIRCGRTRIVNGTSLTAKGCEGSSKYVSWDGIHYTEAANQHISAKILSGKYSDPPLVGKMSFLTKPKC
ncbi:acetylajmaline esterase [Ranunculus cassubicifolius]